MTPGATNKYALNAGLVELDDGAGMPVPSVDLPGQRRLAEFSSDLELVPLGPAIVIKPKQSLDAATTYTIKSSTRASSRIAKATPRSCSTAGSSASFKFKTEDLQPTAARSSAAASDFPARLHRAPDHHAERSHPDRLLGSKRMRHRQGDHHRPGRHQLLAYS